MHCIKNTLQVNTFMDTLVSLCESFKALLNTFRSSSSESVAPGSFCWSGSIKSFKRAGASINIRDRFPYNNNNNNNKN